MEKPNRNDKIPDGNWIETISGQKVSLLDPTEEAIHINDIAHALSRICRYSGHTPEFYSVAEHSIVGSFFIPEPYKLSFLLHDAHEAYIGDMVSPLKRTIKAQNSFDSVSEIESKLDYHIGKKFNAFYMHSEQVKDVDFAMLVVEARTFGFDIDSWGLPVKSSEIVIEKQAFQDLRIAGEFVGSTANIHNTKNRFLHFFNLYGGKA